MSADRVLVIVDIQRAFEPPPAFLKKVERYAKRFQKRIYTRFINPPGSMFRKVLRQKSCPPGSEEAELALQVGEGDVVLDKVGRYGFSASQIRRLHRMKIQKVVVCGMDTDACVLGVMFSLFDAGIECHLNPKMCWSSSGMHSEALAIAKEQFRLIGNRPA